MAKPNAAFFLNDVRMRLDNPAIDDTELLRYIELSQIDVDYGMYSLKDYIAQILDTTCQYLLSDGKFPEVTSISGGGVSTSLTGDGANRFKGRIDARRQAVWIDYR